MDKKAMMIFALRKQIGRIEDLIIIYNRHGIANRIEALCNKAEEIQEEIDGLTHE